MCHFVPLSNDVAAVKSFARTAETRPQRVAVHEVLAIEENVGAGCLVEYGKLCVHPLHDLGVTHGEVHVRRDTRNGVTKKSDTDAKDIHADRCGDRSQSRRQRVLLIQRRGRPLSIELKLFEQLGAKHWVGLMEAKWGNGLRCGHISERCRHIELDRAVEIRLG